MVCEDLEGWCHTDTQSVTVLQTHAVIKQAYNAEKKFGI